jgi:type III pantothenate kinase
MILCIDVGNTHTSFAVFKKSLENDDPVCKFNIATEKNKTEYQLFCEINSILQLFQVNHKNIKEVKIASVVPELNRILSECFKNIFQIKHRFILKENIDLKINLKNPSEVGIDRLINVFAAFHFYGKKKNIVIIDFGTAVTFDVGIKTGEYDGGIIYPGINLSLDALRTGTSKLPKISLTKPESPIGKSTAEAINAGIFYGYSGMVNSIVSHIIAEYKEDFKIILTGGLSGILAPYFNFEYEINEMLNLYGISIL